MLRNSLRNIKFSLYNRSIHTTSSLLSNSGLFDKILIANRGEIVCRVIDTCKKLGIKTVAVYSEADSHSKHVRMADEAVCIGPAPTSESYLRQDRILDVCKRTGAQAVHPGYGFLSENPDFSDLLALNNIKFIGPKKQAIIDMGKKIRSKNIAVEANVNTIPGFIGKVDTPEDAIRVAKDIGYPVMIKASAGGGGKGMRIAWNDAQTREGFRMSRDEAASSFGDDTLFVEKFIDTPRHIEIQILMDQFGNGVYLNERECSIQRRNQKVIEEAPSVYLDAETRKAMGEQAISLARAVEYQSAGTVEFLVDSKRNFYFLEMNTRLQVEHPITEYISGVDLVEHMIRIAAGEKLSIKQSDIGINGWAFESRVYAEDPSRNFLPSIGRLTEYIEPKSNDNTIRCDSGILQGSEISVYYDPLICKLVTHGKDRNTALETMRHALDNYVIRGVTHNIPFLRAVCDNPRFIEGKLSTNFIPEEYPDGFLEPNLNTKDINVLSAAALVVHQRHQIHLGTITGGRLTSYDVNKNLQERLKDMIITIQNKDYSVQMLDENTMKISSENNDSIEVKISSKNYKFGDIICDINVDGESYSIQYHESNPYSYKLQYLGSIYNVGICSREESNYLKNMPEVAHLDTSNFVQSPMPGVVVSVDVEEGQQVVVGEEVVVVEAMKMRNALFAPRDGVVKSVFVKAGDSVESDEIIIELKEEENK